MVSITLLKQQKQQQKFSNVRQVEFHQHSTVLQKFHFLMENCVESDDGENTEHERQHNKKTVSWIEKQFITERKEGEKCWSDDIAGY